MQWQVAILEMSLVGKFDIASFSHRVRFPEFSAPLLAHLPVVCFAVTITICFHSLILKHWHVFSQRLAHIFPIKIPHFLPSSPIFSHSEVSVIASSWEHFYVYIKSVFLSSLIENIFPFPLDSVHSFPLPALLCHFQPRAL